MKRTANVREIRESSDADLQARVSQLEEQLFGARMKRFTNQLENTMIIRQARREIARVKTVLARRKAGAEQKAAATESPAQEK